ncbi:MAG: helix-turn-helix domain-containing protein [Bacteroidia bacterium]|nr:helix-turn-helix domain-containing protein [Bacteroidia bacterium]
MNKTVLISLPIEDLQTVIIDCVNSCLRNNKQESKAPTDQPEQLLTIQEAAEFLSLTVPTMYSKVSKREIPCMKRSKRLYFSRTELLEYIKDGRKKSNAEIEQEAKAYLLNNKKGLNNGK